MEVLNEDWTAEAVGKMHKYRITNLELANQCKYNPRYISTVMNGKKDFSSEKAAEKTKERILLALDELIAGRISEMNESDYAGSSGD